MNKNSLKKNMVKTLNMEKQPISRVNHNNLTKIEVYLEILCTI